jgi:hypothetical protein
MTQANAIGKSAATAEVNPGWGRPGYQQYKDAQMLTLGGAATGGEFVDPATGKMLRAPTTPQELMQAELEARNAALTGQTRSLEANINRGTEELTESENEARRQGTASAAAAGVTNAADLQGGMQALGSKYAGMRANVARDLRSQQQERQRSEDASMFARLLAYQQAGKEDANAQGSRGGGGGRSSSGKGGGGGTDWTAQIGDYQKGESPRLQTMRGGSMGSGGSNLGPSNRPLDQDVVNRSRQLQGGANFMNLANMTARRLGGVG